MSFKEISSWIVLAALSYVTITYAWPLIGSRSLARGDGGEMIGVIVAFVVIVVISHIVIAIFAPKKSDEAEDERDRKIALYAERAAGYALGAVALFGLFFALGDGQRDYANIFFLGLAWSEIVKNAWQIALYRRAS